MLEKIAPFVSEAQRRWMFANKPEMAKRWAKHTPKGKKLPERVKRAQLILDLIRKGIEKRAQTGAFFNPESAFVAGANLYQKLVPTRAGGTMKILSSIVGQPIREALPEAAVKRHLLETFAKSPEYSKMMRTVPAETSIVSGAIRALQRGQRTLETEAPKWGYVETIPKARSLLKDRPTVEKAVSLTQKYIPKTYAAATSFLKERFAGSAQAVPPAPATPPPAATKQKPTIIAAQK